MSNMIFDGLQVMIAGRFRTTNQGIQKFFIAIDFNLYLRSIGEACPAMWGHLHYYT
jgi:hypothetical protein